MGKKKDGGGLRPVGSWVKFNGDLIFDWGKTHTGRISAHKRDATGKTIYVVDSGGSKYYFFESELMRD